MIYDKNDNYDNIEMSMVKKLTIDKGFLLKLLGLIQIGLKQMVVRGAQHNNICSEKLWS